MAMLAQAAGVASMPFFAQLWAKDERFKFATGVADSVSRVIALSLLATSLMIALSQSAVGLIFGGGRFTPGDVNLTAWFFAFYALSLFAWSAQAIYARAFYAAGITWLPMLASTIILLVAFPLYGFGYRMWGAAGLALASDAGIILQALTLALLLHKRRMVSLASLDYAEMGRCLLASCAGGAAAWFVAFALAGLFRHLPRVAELHNARAITDTLVLAGGLAVWTAIAMWILDITGSALPRVAMRRLRLS
jgi:putative peptidoglycan lipid II flippase